MNTRNRVEIRIPRHSRALLGELSKRLKARWKDWEFIFTEAEVERSRIMTTSGLDPAARSEITRLLSQYEREFMATGLPSDTSQEALRQVEQITDSKPVVRGETLLRSRKLKRQLKEARKRIAQKSSRPRR